MADLPLVPPLPPPGEIVSTQALYNTQITLYRNTLAFGGQRNPTDVWASMLRNDSNAISYYREIEEKDPDVANALDTLKLTVLERPHSVQPFDDSDQAREVADFVSGQLLGLPNFDGILDNLLDAPAYGFSVGELIFDTSMGQASLLDIRDCPQELFLFGNRFQPQIGPLQFLANPQASDGIAVPESKFLVFSHRPRSRDRMGRPLLRSVFWSSWFKRNAQRLWLRYAERGPGTAVVRYQDSDSDADKAQAAELAQAMIEYTAMAVPQGFTYDAELLNSTRPMDPAVYEHLYEAMQLDIVRRVLGETLTSFGGEKGKGTQALGEVHSDTLEKKSIGICKALAGVINWQLVRPLVLWNFGPQAPMPRWAYEIAQAEDLDKKLNREKVLQGMGLTFTEAYLRKTYEVPAPEAGDVVVTPSATAGAEPAIPDAADTTFSDSAAEASAHRELKQFDQLMGQLRTESVGLMGQRVKEVADAIGGK